MDATEDDIKLEDLEFHDKLGEGGGGTVYRVTFKTPFKGYKEAAAKNIISLRKEEVEIMRKLRHPNVVTFLGFCKKGPICMIILEYAKNGSLHDYLKDQSKPLPLTLMQKWLKEAALAMKYLHDENVLHRDIKANNCLLFADSVLKLCDFGLAREIELSQTTSSMKGTSRYMAPELIVGNAEGRAVYSKPADIYAYGMLILEIFTRIHPFADWVLPNTIMFRVGKGEQPTIPEDCPQLWSKIMQQCWDKNPQQRPTIQDILKGSLFEESLEESRKRRISMEQNDDISAKSESNPLQMPNQPNTAPRKFVRGISKANARIVGLTRQAVVEDESDTATGHHLVETPIYTFVLPDLDIYHPEFRSFIEKDLLEMTTMVSLENANVLNWWSDACPKLWPMATAEDGNCPLHAASLGMWGFHDRQLTLRKALYHALTENSRSPRMQRLKRRWRWQQSLVNKESGLVYSEEEWEEEWKSLLKLASAEPRLPHNKSPTSTRAPTLSTLAEEPESPTELSPAYDDDEDPLYESLEEFHVFVLANILQRPILVVADTVLRDADGEALAPIPFGGIYLPLDCQVYQCQKIPVVLTYDAAHFSALVPMEKNRSQTAPPEKDDVSHNQAVIPVTDHDHHLLPLHFSVDPGPNWQWNKDENDNSANPTSNKFNLSVAQKLVILKRYLNLVIVPIPGMKRNISVDSSKSENGFDRQISSSSSESDKNEGKNGTLELFSGLEKSGGKKGKVDIQATSIASSTQNDRIPQITMADLEDLSSVVGAKMTERRHQLHEEMIRNYLQRAKGGYDEEQKLLRLLENESSLHNQQASPTRSHQRQRISDAGNPRIIPVLNPSSQIGNPLSNHTDLPVESHHNPRRGGIPNQYPAPVRNKAISQPNRGRPVSQPINHNQVPASNVYVDRRTDQRHFVNNASNHMPLPTRHKGYSPPHAAGMRSAPQFFPPGMRPAPQNNKTSPDGRMSVPDSRMVNPSRSNNLGNRSPQAPRGRPVSQPSMSSQSHPPTQYNSYDMNKVEKALPKSERPEHRSQGNDRADGGARAGTKPCRSPDCDFYGTQDTDYFCSKCYQTKAKSIPPTQGKQKKEGGGAFWKK